MGTYNAEQRKQYDRTFVRRAGSPGRGPQNMPAAAESFVEERLFDLGELNTKTNNLRCTRMNEVISELLAVVWPPARLIKWVGPKHLHISKSLSRSFRAYPDFAVMARVVRSRPVLFTSISSILAGPFNGGAISAVKNGHQH